MTRHNLGWLQRAVCEFTFAVQSAHVIIRVALEWKLYMAIDAEFEVRSSTGVNQRMNIYALCAWSNYCCSSRLCFKPFNNCLAVGMPGELKAIWHEVERRTAKLYIEKRSISVYFTWGESFTTAATIFSRNDFPSMLYDTCQISRCWIHRASRQRSKGRSMFEKHHCS